MSTRTITTCDNCKRELTREENRFHVHVTKSVGEGAAGAATYYFDICADCIIQISCLSAKWGPL